MGAGVATDGVEQRRRYRIGRMRGHAESDLEPVIRGGLLLGGDAGARLGHAGVGFQRVEPQHLVEHVGGDARSAQRAQGSQAVADVAEQHGAALHCIDDRIGGVSLRGLRVRRRPAGGKQRPHPIGEAGRPRNPTVQVGELEVRVRVDEAGHQHATAEVRRVRRHRRCDGDDPVIFDRDRAAFDRRAADRQQPVGSQATVQVGGLCRRGCAPDSS